MIPIEIIMYEGQWIEWARTQLSPAEGEGLLNMFTPAQKAHLLEHDYVWVEGIGVTWKHPDGNLRRARFTHGAHIRTERGELYVDSEGAARSLSDRAMGDGLAPESSSTATNISSFAFR